MKARLLPSIEELQSLFTYESETGNLYAKVKLSKKTQSGDLLSCKNAKGYIHFNLNGLFYYAHRVIWKLVTEEEPNIIDHIKGEKSDNRFCNLRSVNSSQNNLNYKDAKGYYMDNRAKVKKYVVEVKGVYLGAFTTAEEARENYLEARKKFSGL